MYIYNTIYLSIYKCFTFNCSFYAYDIHFSLCSWPQLTVVLSRSIVNDRKHASITLFWPDRDKS